MTIRTAVIMRRGQTPRRETVEAYLPRNYSILAELPDRIFITGTDNAGWTLDGYVIPRLASGLIHAREITAAAE
jgi:hypothetical protein